MAVIPGLFHLDLNSSVAVIYFTALKNTRFDQLVPGLFQAGAAGSAGRRRRGALGALPAVASLCMLFDSKQW